jgi:NADPH-dependent 2,4-dienoyl-CoA reductase/sulfur reductase-like enzyme
MSAESTRWTDQWRPGVELLAGTTVIDAERDADGFRLVVESSDGSREIHAAKLVLATGARELFLPFPGWTFPGVLGVGAIQAMVKSGFQVRDNRVIIAGTGPLLVAVAAHLVKHGARVIALVEQASVGRMLRFAIETAVRPTIMSTAVKYASAIPPRAVNLGTWVRSVAGEGQTLTARLTDGRRDRTMECDLLCVGYGLVPNTELARLLGCEASAGGIVVDEKQRTTVDGIYAAGECVGIAGVAAALGEGTAAGWAAAGKVERRRDVRARVAARRWGTVLERSFALRPEIGRLAGPDTIVCRCEDVRLGAIDSLWTARQAKLYTRIGMGPCQGRICGPAMGHLREWAPDRVRAPIYPSLVSSLADKFESANPGED